MFRGSYLMTKIANEKARREGTFGFLIQIIARELDSRMKAELAEIGVDLKLFANLMMLLAEDGINQRQLGRKLNFPEYFTSRNIDALVNAGLAERRPDPDSRRSFLIFLTDAGRTTAAKLPPIINQVNEDVLAEFSQAEKKQMIALLRKVAAPYLG